MAGPVVLVVDPVSQTAERVAQALVGTRYVVRAAKDATEADLLLRSDGALALSRSSGAHFALQVRRWVIPVSSSSW